MLEDTTDRIVVRIPAVLRGMGKAVSCVLEIWQEETVSGRQYTRCNIANDPPDLPDGSYQVEFEQHLLRTKKSRGKWELVFLLPALRPLKAA